MVRAWEHRGERSSEWWAVAPILLPGVWAVFSGDAWDGLLWEARGGADALVGVGGLGRGLGIRAAGRVFGLDANTVESWLVGAAQQLTVFAAHMMVDLELEQVQLDEIFASLAHLLASGVEFGEVSGSSSWLWTAMDPVSKLLLVMVVGDRSLAVAQVVVHQVKRRLAAHCLPLFLTDGLAHYKTALLMHFGQWMPPCGTSVKPRWFPVPGLVYAQVIKTVRRGRLVRVKQRLVFGCLEEVQARLGRWGWKINTAFVERLNLTTLGGSMCPPWGGG